MFSCIRMRPFPYMLKSAYKPFLYVPMIKQALKKHGTMESHAIDAKKIVFSKDNFIYYSYSY